MDKKINAISKKISYSLLLLAFFSLPFERIPTFEIANFTIKASYLFALFFLLTFFLFRKPLSLLAKYPLLISDRFLILFLLSGFVSLSFSPDIKRSSIILALWVFMVIFYLVITRFLKDNELIRKILNAILFSSIIVSLFGVLQFIGDSFGFPASLTGLRPQYTKVVMGFPRIQSVALEPLYFANFLLVPFFISLVRYIQNKDLFKGYFLFSILVLVTLILTLSRGAYIALAVSLTVLFIYLFVNRKKANYLNKLVGVITIIVLSILISFGMIFKLNGKNSSNNFIEHSVVEDVTQDGSANDRIGTYLRAYSLFKEKPIFGNGPGSFGVLTKSSEEELKEKGYGIVNNEYIELLAENGIVGLTLFLLFLLFYIAEVFPVYTNAAENNRLMLVGLSLGMMAIFIQYNFFSTLYIIYIWAFLGLLKAGAYDAE